MSCWGACAWLHVDVRNRRVKLAVRIYEVKPKRMLVKALQSYRYGRRRWLKDNMYTVPRSAVSLATDKESKGWPK